MIFEESCTVKNDEVQATVRSCDNVITPSPKTDGVENNSLINNTEIKERGEFNGATKLYKRRWLQLGLFFIYAAANSMQWVQFTIVGNIISRYYGVSTLAVDWTSLLYHVMYVIVLPPASYVMSRVGLRWTCLIGALGTTIGSWIKFFSSSPDRFILLFIGQAIVGSCQVFVLPGPARLAAAWFGPNEVATATAIGVFGVMGGIGSFFIIIPMLVKDHENTEYIRAELYTIFLTVAVFCTLITVALFFFFQEKPPLPPSKASALAEMKRRIEGKTFIPIIKRILTNRSFVMLWNSYGLNSGFLNVISTLLNPLFLTHFQNGERDAGTLGLLLNIPGNLGSIIFCMILDRTKNFKSLGIFIYVFSLVGEIIFAAGLIMEIKWLIFVAILIIGVFTISYGTVILELSAETTYPEPEEVSSAILNVAQQVYGTVLVLITGWLLRTYGDKIAHVFLVAILTLGLSLAIITKNDLRRQNATKYVQCKPDTLIAAEA